MSVSIGVSGSDVTVKLQQGISSSTFSSITALLKLKKFRWSPKQLVWRGSVFKFDELKEELEELDILEYENGCNLDKLREGTPEIRIESNRVIPDFNTLKYPPIVGKPPFEKFQRIDIASGLTRNRYAYFLGMGTGKSYIAAALIAHYMYAWNRIGKTLIITTSIGVRNFRAELKKFLSHYDESKIIIGDKDCRDPFRPDIDIVITSYNSFRLICNHYRHELGITSKHPRAPFLPIGDWLNGSEGMLLLDESHNIANPQSQQGGLVALHAPAFEYRYLFTGTPADKPEKLYNQFKVLDPVLTHNLSYTDWLGVYANIGNRFSKYAVNSWKRDKLEELNKRFTAKYGIYRDSTDVVELPPHYEKRIVIPMSREHRKIYEEFVTHELEEAKHHEKTTTRDIANKFPYMMLSVENPRLLEKHIDKFDDRLASRVLMFNPLSMEKIRVLKEILEEVGDAQGVIWIVHPKTAELLAEEFASYNPLVITGESKEGERVEILDKFRQPKSKHQLLIANIQILNTSVTITNATWQCYVERSFNYVIYSQSLARIYRIGQNKSVKTYIPIYEKTLDVFLDQNLSSKDSLLKGLLAKDFLTQEQWVSIFNGGTVDNFQ